MNKIIPAILCILLAGACNFKDPKVDGVVYKKGYENKQPLKTTAYRYRNDSITQQLALEWLTKDQVRFELSTENSRSRCTMQLSGTAVNRFAGQDPEMDEDEQGNAYPSEQFTYENGACQTFLRIATDKTKAQVLTVSCNDEGCPLSGFGVMKKTTD